MTWLRLPAAQRPRLDHDVLRASSTCRVIDTDPSRQRRSPACAPPTARSARCEIRSRRSARDDIDLIVVSDHGLVSAFRASTTSTWTACCRSAV